MKIRALRTFSVFHDGQIHVFNAGKNGEPGEAREVDDDLAAACHQVGHSESVGAEFAVFDHDGDGHPGGSLPAEPTALTGKNKAALLAIAEAEGVSIEEGATNAAIIEAIEAARPAPEPDPEEAPPA